MSTLKERITRVLKEAYKDGIGVRYRIKDTFEYNTSYIELDDFIDPSLMQDYLEDFVGDSWKRISPNWNSIEKTIIKYSKKNDYDIVKALNEILEKIGAETYDRIPVRVDYDQNNTVLAGRGTLYDHEIWNKIKKLYRRDELPTIGSFSRELRRLVESGVIKKRFLGNHYLKNRNVYYIKVDNEIDKVFNN